MGLILFMEVTRATAPAQALTPAKRVSVVSVRLVREKSVLYASRKILTAKQAVEFIKDFLRDLDREKFIVIGLNSINEPILIDVVSVGTVDASIVHPREILKSAILASASSIVLAHNHPSGDPSPSDDDISITRRLQEAGNLMGIPVLDHVITGEGTRYISLREQGYIKHKERSY